MENLVKYHNVIWTSEKINNFWNFETSHKTNQEDWFAFQFSDPIKSFISKKVLNNN
jgi:hypothetical protein